MNYLALFFAILATLVALAYAAQVIRVILGKAYFNSTFAVIVNFCMPPSAGVLAFWLFRTAVGA